MFWSTTIIRELQCPCQSHYYLTTVVCMLAAYAATPPRLAYIQLRLNNSDFGKDIVTP